MKNNTFKEVDQNLDLVPIEKSILKYWEENKIFSKVMNKNEKKDRWVYYDGPITANGLPHYGHGCTWTMKDVLPRYWTMRGKYVPRNMGWDCQGILVEYEVEKALKFESKGDIERYGVDRFNQACKESVLKFRDSMIEYETRLGRWISEDQYSTMDKDYIESMWWAIKELKEKGLLYEGHKVVAYSTRAGMTLSSHEVADGGYKKVIDPAITVEFKLSDSENTYLLAWTTTPYTIPGNLLLAVGESIRYAKVEYSDKKYVVAEDLVEKIFDGKEHKVVGRLLGKDLVGKNYTPPFDYFSDREESGAFKIVSTDFVNTDEGTGIVHLAPYGEDDFVVLLEQGIPMFDYLDETGNFTELVEPYKGMFYKKANKFIIEDLKNENCLFDHRPYEHNMPVSYRTKEPLIYKPIKSWYVDITKLKPKLLAEANKLNIVPPEMDKRFVSWVKNARDWSLSRRRYWGTPMPIWKNDKTGETLFIGSYKELEERSGKKIPKDFDPHKPYVDEVVWGNKESGFYRRVPEVVDVWFDSGSMPFAQHHYPFENNSQFKQNFPADYISEGDDQIRLWFYTMFVLGVALFDTSPFKNVIVIGMLGDEKGKKMSKSAGNYPPIEEVFNEYGSDMLRYFLLTGGIARGLPTAFSYSLLVETKKEIFTMLWNSYKYYVTYADPENQSEVGEKDVSNVMDKWILTRLEELVVNVNQNLVNYEVMYAARLFAPFVQDLSTWYIRRSRDRISTGDNEALNTLFTCLITLTKLLSPFTPFLAESMYLNLTLNKQKDSVHLTEFPYLESTNNEDLSILENMRKVREYSSLANAVRKLNNIPVRQPLSVLAIKGEKLDASYIKVLKDELNVKEVDIVKSLPKDKKVWIANEEVALNVLLSDELRLEGRFRNLVREVQNLRKQAGLNVDQSVKLQLVDNKQNREVLKVYKSQLLARVGADSVKFGDVTKIE